MTTGKQYSRLYVAARWLILLYVAILPIVRPLDTRILGIHVFATDIIFAAAFFCWVFSCLHRPPLIERRYMVFAGAFSLALTTSAIFSTESQKSLVKLIGVFYLIAVSIVVADLVRDLDFLKQLSFAWVAGASITILGTVAGFVGFYLGFDSMASNFFLFHSGSLPPGNYPRVVAFFENPNMTANYANIALMIVIAAGRIGWLPKRLVWLIAALLLAATILAISPGLGGMLLSIGLWGFFAVLSSEQKLRWLVAAGTVGAALIIFVSTTISPVTRRADQGITIPIIGRQIEPSVRFLVWKDSITRGLEYPMLGRGTGTDAAHLRYDVISGQRQLLRDAHQAWLNIFGQAGFVGLAAFAALCWYLFSICRFRIGDGSEVRLMLVGCSCAFVGAFLYQNLSGSFEDARQIWVLIGMIVGLSAADRAN